MEIREANKEGIRFVLLDGAGMLLPHFLPGQYVNPWDWMPLDGTRIVAHDSERDVLRLHHGKAAAASHSIADDLTVGCDDEGRPVCVDITGATELLLAVSENVMAYATRR